MADLFLYYFIWSDIKYGIWAKDKHNFVLRYEYLLPCSSISNLASN